MSTRCSAAQRDTAQWERRFLPLASRGQSAERAGATPLFGAFGSPGVAPGRGSLLPAARSSNRRSRATMAREYVRGFTRDSVSESLAEAKHVRACDWFTFRERGRPRESRLRCRETDSDREDLCHLSRSRLRGHLRPPQGTCHPSDHATRERQKNSARIAPHLVEPPNTG